MNDLTEIVRTDFRQVRAHELLCWPLQVLLGVTDPGRARVGGPGDRDGVRSGDSARIEAATKILRAGAYLSSPLFQHSAPLRPRHDRIARSCLIEVVRCGAPPVTDSKNISLPCHGERTGAAPMPNGVGVPLPRPTRDVTSRSHPAGQDGDNAALLRGIVESDQHDLAVDHFNSLRCVRPRWPHDERACIRSIRCVGLESHKDTSLVK
jgi:hypothetical protein